MSSIRLRLNPAKTKFILLGNRNQFAKLDLAALTCTTEFPDYTFSTTVRDLGILLDQELTFALHIHRLARDCYYHLRQLRAIARSFTPIATTTLVHSFIAAGREYCSSLYFDLPSNRLVRLDRVLRSAARLTGQIQ